MTTDTPTTRHYSDQALEAAKARVLGRKLTGWAQITEAADAMHDPALGPCRSIHLAQITAYLRDWANHIDSERISEALHEAIDDLERELGTA